MKTLFLLSLLGQATAVLGFVLNRSSGRLGHYKGADEYGAHRTALTAQQASPSNDSYDVVIIGCGVGGHGAALHSVGQGLRTAVISGNDVGGTCVNRGCVPSKALLAAAGRLRDFKNREHFKQFGIQLDGTVSFQREGIAKHAEDLASKVRNGLSNSLASLGVDVYHKRGTILDNYTIRLDDPASNAGSNAASTAGSTSAGSSKVLKAKHIILAPGSVPFVPKGIEVDEQTVFTSDGGLKLPFVPEWLAIVGSGYIGLEFSDVFTAMGSEVTFIEAQNRLMPTFDTDIARIADRLLIKGRGIDSRTGVFASEISCGVLGKKPVTIKLIDAKTKELVEVLQPDGCMIATGRVPSTNNLGLENIDTKVKAGGFIPVDDTFRVLNTNGTPLGNVYCIGDANGVLMLAHAASAQGINVIDSIVGHTAKLNHRHIPAACFTHPEIAFVGLTEDQSKAEGHDVGKVISHFRGNSKALAELEGDGIAKVLYDKKTLKLLGVHIIGLHASDLIQECSNAMAAGSTVMELSKMVHTHPTLSEVMDSAFKQAVGVASH